jgi:bifunctional ADP-heptose synthase (sugar kinase/adenylyltransferase)
LKTDINGADRSSVRAAIGQLEQRLNNDISLITLSEHGIHAHRGGEEFTFPAHARSIADVSGAGDTVIAVAALCLAQGLPLDVLAAWANLAGGLVCEHVGVVPIDRTRLLEEARDLALPGALAGKA